MRPGEYGELTAFAAVARAASFRAAAAELNLRPSTLSHAVRALEDRLGVKLLARTTRSVAPTVAGAALLANIGPALLALDEALTSVNDYRARPQGPVRLTVPESAAASIVAPKIGEFLRLCPDVELEISVNSGFIDIVKERFDAGIRLGESVGVGMTAVRVSDALRGAVVAAPGYWARYGQPNVPTDLAKHRCINRRYAPGRALHRWHFARKAEVVEIPCRGPLILDAEWLLHDAALQGAGVAYIAEAEVQADITSGKLERVLEDWCPPMFTYYLYHSSQRLPSAGLSALIDALRWSAP